MHYWLKASVDKRCDNLLQNCLPN